MSLKREREKDCLNCLYVSVLIFLPAVLTSHFEFLLRHVDLTMSVPCLKSGWSLDPFTEQREPFMTWLLLTVPAQFSTLPLGHLPREMLESQMLFKASRPPPTQTQRKTFLS